MSGLVRHRFVDIVAEPWRNGGGVTRVVAAHGDAWRVSIADIDQDGDYSRFSGTTRQSALLRGTGLTLANDHRTLTLVDDAVITYDGGASWHVTLHAGAVQAFNVFASTASFASSLTWFDSAQQVDIGSSVVVFAVHQGCDVRLGDATVSLAPLDYTIVHCDAAILHVTPCGISTVAVDTDRPTGLLATLRSH